MRIYDVKTNEEHLVIEVCEAFPSMEGSEEKILEYVKSERNHLIVCFSNEETIIGYTLVYQTERPNAMMYIHHIEVLEDFRRQGIATKMIDYTKNLCKIYGIRKMFLFTKDDNIPAKNLYLKTLGKTISNDKLTFEYEIDI